MVLLWLSGLFLGCVAGILIAYAIIYHDDKDVKR